MLSNYSGFPELVDKLPPEVGDHIGPEPTLYSKTIILSYYAIAKLQ